MDEWFRNFAAKTSEIAGTHYIFALAVAIVIIWSVSGPIFQFSETWQLVINTGTTIITFLMVFLIQNAQNRQAKEQKLQLDALIQAGEADNKFSALDDMTNQELDDLLTKIKEEHSTRNG